MSENTSFYGSDNQNRPENLLNYPYNKADRYGAYVCFFPQEIDGPGLLGNDSIFDVLKTIGKSMVSVASPENFSKNDPPPGIEVKKAQLRTLYKDAMKIYLPTAFTTTDTLTYDSPSIGVTGGSIEGGLNNAEGSVATIFGKGIENFMASFKTGGDTTLGKLGLARLSNKLGTANMGNGVTSALRVTVDPNIRTLFRGVGIRNFQFQFKFLAVSAEEAKKVEQIIYRFRYYAYPESILLTNQTNFTVGFKFPNPFQIYVKYRDAGTPKYEDITDSDGSVVGKYVSDVEFGKSTQIGPRLKTCYLTNVTTNYNPTTMAFHADGKPVEIDLSLSFTEQTTLNRKDIVDGF